MYCLRLADISIEARPRFSDDRVLLVMSDLVQHQAPEQVDETKLRFPPQMCHDWLQQAASEGAELLFKCFSRKDIRYPSHAADQVAPHRVFAFLDIGGRQ